MKLSLTHVLTFTTLLFTQSLALGAGFEKSVLWSAKYGAIGGAATASADDAQSLYFNPAGLSQVKGIEFTGNLSPTFSKFKGPIVSSGVNLDGNQTFSPAFGAFIGYKLTDGLGIGMGSYVAGGTRSKYEGVSYAARNPIYDTLRPTIETDLKIIEYSLGLGYEIMDGLRIGGAWRLTQVDARFSSAATVPVASIPLINLNLTNLNATRYNGFRIGGQYAPKNCDFSFGASFRSTLSFNAKGDIGGFAESALGDSLAMTGSTGTAEIAGTFPMQLNLGTAYKLGAYNRVMMDYAFTRYALNRKLDVSGSAITTRITGTPFAVDAADVELHWTNQHNIRLGYQTQMSDDLTLRGGYVLTSQVTSAAFARATIASPGMGHTLVAGVGKSLMGGRLDVDVAVEYSFASGSGTYVESATTSIAGDFSSRAIVAHTGVSYRF